MTIRRGVDWGRPGRLHPGAPVVGSDAELRALVEAARRRPPGGEAPPPEVGLTGGDLWRTLGGGSGGDDGSCDGRGGDGVRVPIDVVRATLDGHDHWFTAHLVAHQWAWRGRFVVAMNAPWLGPWRLGPRAHPGDGLVDVTDGALPLRQRLQARRRAPHGEHLPHPALRTRRVGAWSTTFARPVPVWLDGVRQGRCRALELTVEPDALVVVVRP